MPDITDMYEKINKIVRDLGQGDILNYEDALDAITELLTAYGDYTDPAAAARSHLQSAGFSSQSDVGKYRLTAIPLPADTATTRSQAELAQSRRDPEAAYLRQRGLPAYGGSPFESWQRSQFAPTYATYQAASALEPKTSPAAFGDYLGQGYSPTDIENRASRLFQQASGAPAAQQEYFQRQMGGSPENRMAGQDLVDLLQAALNQRYAYPVAQRMGQWIPGMATQYAAETTGTGKALLDYISRGLRLS